MFHALMYNDDSATAGATNEELAGAATDNTFTRTTNNRFIFTEPLNLLAIVAGGASMTRGRIRSSRFSAFGEFAITAVNRSLDPPANPMYKSYLWNPLPLPSNEELIVEASNNLAMGNEQENILLLVAPHNWNQNVARGNPFLTVRASQSITQILNAWSTETTIALDANLRGGWWAVIGARCQSDDAFAFRIVFPRMRESPGGKYLKPGWIVQNATGDAFPNSLMMGENILGNWGAFHTFELPRLQTFGTVAGAETVVLTLDLMFMGEGDPSRYPI